MKVFETCVVTMYDRSSPTTNVDATRLDMFARKERSYEAIPPTLAALHTKRAAYQVGANQQCLMPKHLALLTGAGRSMDLWKICWTTTAYCRTCEQLTKCGCKTDCRGRSKFYRVSIRTQFDVIVISDPLTLLYVYLYCVGIIKICITKCIGN
jgi:hypothetical protein